MLAIAPGLLSPRKHAGGVRYHRNVLREAVVAYVRFLRYRSGGCDSETAADPTYDHSLTFGVNNPRSFCTIFELLYVEIVQLRCCCSRVQWALGIAHVHALALLPCLRALRRWEDRGQTSTGIPNKIAFAGRSSLMTMVAINTVTLCNLLLALVLEERDTPGALMSYRMFLSKLAFPPEILFDPPVTTDDHSVTRAKPLLRFSLVPTRLGKKTASTSAVVSTESGGPHCVALICPNIASGLHPH